MKVEMFLTSPKGISPIGATHILVNHKVLANITAIHSSVYNKKADDCFIEKGVKIEIFDISPEKLIHLWINGFKNREDLDFHCAYINTPDYSGCILNTSWYIDFCVSHALIPEKCSEY